MPPTLTEKINKKLLEKLNLAYISVDNQMKVKQTFGNLEHYGFTKIAVGDDVTEHMDIMVGMDSSQALSLPVISSPAGVPVSISLIPEADRLTVVIADAKDQFDLQQLLQQKANENQLLTEKQRRLLAKLHKTKAELQEKNSKLEQASLLQSGFLSGVSHEFRTPLSSIIGYSELLQQNHLAQYGPHHADTAEHIAIIRRAGNHLLSLVENLLDHGKLDADEIVINPKPVELGSLIIDVEQLLRPMAAAKQIEFVIRNQFDSPVWLYLDESRMRQCLINLIGNAIKFTDHGSVTVTSVCDEQLLRISVHDTGIGIRKTDLSKITQPFWQASDTGKTGTGLGLSITKRIVELMAGSLSVSSKFEKGTQVTMELDAPRIPGFSEQSLSAKSTFDSKISILLAEDDYDIAQLVLLLLEEANADVTHVENGELAIEAIHRQDYDLVLMDINMPRMNGYEAIEILRKEGNKIPIIVMTASIIEADKQRAEKLHCDGYLTKPVAVADIVALAEQVLSQS